MIVLDPAALTGLPQGGFAYSTEDNRPYLVTDDGAIPVIGWRGRTQLTDSRLVPMSANWFRANQNGARLVLFVSTGDDGDLLLSGDQTGSLLESVNWTDPIALSGDESGDLLLSGSESGSLLAAPTDGEGPPLLVALGDLPPAAAANNAFDGQVQGLFVASTGQTLLQGPATIGPAIIGIV